MAAIINFLTVPSELQPIAHACQKSLRQTGYLPKYEYREDHFPETATIYVKQKQEQRFYIFDARIKEDRTALWSGYGRSCSLSTYITLCIPKNIEMTAAEMVRIRRLGIGVTAIDDDGTLTELVAPMDLSLTIELPPLDRHRVEIKRELAKIHERFGRGEWKRGFEEACKIVEKAARKHLCREARAGLVQVPGRKGLPKTLSATDIKSMPLGALAQVFCQKLTPSPIDALLCMGLRRINPDRVNVAHAKTDNRTEQRLRNNVGKHMWTIDNLLKTIPA